MPVVSVLLLLFSFLSFTQLSLRHLRQDTDRFLFRTYAWLAGKENEDRTKLLSGGNALGAARGDYRGGGLPVGFIVDRDKLSPTFGRFLVYEPHAAIVRRLYKRYRELNGRFSALAKEVAAMPYVFPDFESWVDERDIRACFLKKVPGGYHMTKRSLFRLLTAPEYAGYWVYSTGKNDEGELEYALLTDEQGKPVQNHEAIVPLADWRFAFDRLSFTHLDGEENTDRPGRHTTWTQQGKTVQEALLKGILTSPPGYVYYGNGSYRIMTPVPEMHGHYENTLSVNASDLDSIFTEHFLERMNDVVYGRTIKEMLQQVQQQHAEELITIPEQIKGYEAEIAARQGYILAVGNSGDVKTIQKFDTEIKELRGIISALEAKETKAAVEEEVLQKIVHNIDKVRHDWGKMKLDRKQFFISLITRSVSIKKLSTHFLRFTVVWRGPSRQPREYCYIFRSAGAPLACTPQDEEDLRNLYPHADRYTILQRFPQRSWMSIVTWAYEKGIKRYVQGNAGDIPARLSLEDWEIIQQHPSWNYNEQLWQGSVLAIWPRGEAMRDDRAEPLSEQAISSREFLVQY
jgi:hypothetical protein